MEDTYRLPIWVGVELKHAGEGCGAALGARRVGGCCQSCAGWCLSPQPVLSHAEGYLLSLSLLRAVLFTGTESAAYDQENKPSPAPQSEPGSGLCFLSFSLLC